ncbi:MAG: hypothetical protein GY756_09060 [bacterium]|nr:hypothetical protein [bacterium]
MKLKYIFMLGILTFSCGEKSKKVEEVNEISTTVIKIDDAIEEVGAKYTISNIPSNVLEIKFADNILGKGDSFRTEDESFTLAYKTEDGIFDLLVSPEIMNIYFSKTLDIDRLIKLQPKHLDAESAQDDFLIHGAWIKPIETPIALDSRVFPTFGFDGETPIPGPFEENEIFGQSPFFKFAAIVNPTVSIVGAEIIITIGSDKKSILITNEIFENKLTFKEVFKYAAFWEQPDEEFYNTMMIPGINLDYNPPYIGTEYHIELIKDGNIISEANGSINPQEYDHGYLDIRYNPKESIFRQPDITPQDNNRYLYVDKKFSNGYLIVYKGAGFVGNDIWTPLYIGELLSIDASPVTIEILAELVDYELMFCVTDDLNQINIVSADSINK